MKSKKRSKPTRREKMTRAARQKDALLWIKDYQGKVLVQKYKKRYGLDSIVKAVNELLTLGAKLDREYVVRIKKSVENNIAHAIAKKDSKPVFYSEGFVREEIADAEETAEVVENSTTEDVIVEAAVATEEVANSEESPVVDSAE